MMTFTGKLVFLCLVVLSPQLLSSGSAKAQGTTLVQLLEQTKNDRDFERKRNKKREQRFTNARDNQLKMIRKVKKKIADEKARTDKLQKEFEHNEEALSTLHAEIKKSVDGKGE